MGVIKKPIITEKSQKISENLNQYSFMVEPTATKDEIIAEVSKIYGVEVTGISTMRYSGKRKARMSKSGVVIGRKNAFKKAIVTINKDQSIDFFESI
jgi:large subunit ribosomal protein L23